MEHDDSNGNVYSLFPGIDTTPFGDAADPARREPPDDGWSAVPEQTVAVDDSGTPAGDAVPASGPPGAEPDRRRLGRRAAAAIAASLTVGLVIAAARSELGSSPAPLYPPAVTGTGFSALLGHHSVLSEPVFGSDRRTKVAHYAPNRARRLASDKPRIGSHPRRASTGSASATATESAATTTPSPTGNASSSTTASRTTTPVVTVPITTPPPRSPSATSASTHQTGASRPAFGENGLLGPGHSPDG